MGVYPKSIEVVYSDELGLVDANAIEFMGQLYPEEIHIEYTDVLLP